MEEICVLFLFFSFQSNVCRLHSNQQRLGVCFTISRDRRAKGRAVYYIDFASCIFSLRYLSSSLCHTPPVYLGSFLSSWALLISASVIWSVGSLYLIMSLAQTPIHFAEGTVRSRKCAAFADPDIITIAMCSP